MEAVLDISAYSTSTSSAEPLTVGYCMVDTRYQQRIAAALDAFPTHAPRVSDRTIQMGAALLAYATREGLRDPEIVVEVSGELAFEWYKDRHHLLVLTVENDNLKWIAMTGPGAPNSGAQPFDQEMPPPVVAAIAAVI